MKITFTGYRQTATLATLAFVTTLAGCTMARQHRTLHHRAAMVYPYATSNWLLARRMPLTVAGVISSTIRFYRN